MNSQFERNRIRKRRHKSKRAAKLLMLLLEIALLVTLVLLFKSIFFKKDRLQVAEEITESADFPDWISVQYIDRSNPSRTGLRLDGINNIVIHYVGNPGTTAQQNHDFYSKEDSDVSSHFVIGLDGEIIQCIPLDERSSASNHRNHDTISIEVCHPEADGKFTEASYKSLIKLTDWLLDTFDLQSDDVIRHYDITGKECPLYFVEHEDAWEQFKKAL